MENVVKTNSHSRVNDGEDVYSQNDEDDEEMIDYQFFGSPDSGGDGHPPIHILPNASEFPSDYRAVRAGSTGDSSTSDNRISIDGNSRSFVRDSRLLRERPEIFHNLSPFPLHLGNLFDPIRQTRRKRSIVHEHFRLNVEESRYYCKHCPLNYAKTRDSSTGQLQLHLKKKHRQLIFDFKEARKGDTNSVGHFNNLPNIHSQSPQNLHRPISELPEHETETPSSEQITIKTEAEVNSPEVEIVEQFTNSPQVPKIVSSASLVQSQGDRENYFSHSSGSPSYHPNKTSSRSNNKNTVHPEKKASMFNMSQSTSRSASLNQPAESDTPQHKSISGIFGVIGGGNMAKAILLPLFELKVLDPSKVVVSGTKIERLELWQKLGCATTTDNCKVIENSDTILWSVKPQMFPKVLDQIKGQVNAQIPSGFYHKLHLSVLAGISLLQFREMLTKSLFWAKVWQHEGSFDNLPEFSRTPVSAELAVQPAVRVARIMPNMGLRVKAGCAAYCLGARTTSDDEQVIKTLFARTGVCVSIDEAQAHAYGVMIGCGIGFMFPLMEAFSDGAVRVGIPREASLKLAAQAMKGAAELYLQEGLHPAVLKDSVCSPAGTTIAGIAELERNGIRSALISAVEASTKRSEELGKLADQAQANK